MVIETAVVSAAEKIGVAAVGFVAEQALEHIDDVAGAGVEVLGCVAEGGLELASASIDVLGSVAEGGCELIGDVVGSFFSLFD